MREREKNALWVYLWREKKQVVSIYVYKIEAMSEPTAIVWNNSNCLLFVRSFVWCVMDSTSAGISCHANINKQPNWIYEAKIVPQRTYGNNETNKPSEYDILKDGSRCARNVIRAMS